MFFRAAPHPLRSRICEISVARGARSPPFASDKIALKNLRSRAPS